MSNRGWFAVSAATEGLNHGIFAEGTADSRWLAGLIAADGSVSRDLRRWSVAQSGDDGRALVEHVRSLIRHTASVSTTQPPSGRPSHGIHVGSPAMVADLVSRYRIMPVKTLTYEWPDLGPAAASAFLRGYIDGDGCTAVYRTPQGNPMLHLSFVGTPAFIKGAVQVIPAQGRVIRIERCANLSELRFTGRHAWAACQWIYADPDLYESRKCGVFHTYATSIPDDPPQWYVNRIRRERVLGCLASGMSLRDTATATGTHLSVVCKWKAAA